MENFSFDRKKPGKPRKTLQGPYEATRPPAGKEAGGKKHKKSENQPDDVFLEKETLPGVTFGELDAKALKEPEQESEKVIVADDVAVQEAEELEASDLISDEETKAVPPPIPTVKEKRAATRRKKLPEGVGIIQPFTPTEDQRKAAEKAPERPDIFANKSRAALERETRLLGEAHEKAKADYQSLKKDVRRRVQEAKSDLEAKGLSPEKIAVSIDSTRRKLNKELDAASQKTLEAGHAYEERYKLWEQAEAEKQASNQAAEEAQARKERAAGLAARVDKALADEDAKERRIAEMGARVEQTMETEEETAWFEQGEDPAHVQRLAEARQEEDARAAADVRRTIAESYDETRSETVLDTDEELEAAAAQAETMLARGDLSAEVFNAKDYRYLLLRQAELDRELESAGWWQARKLRKELRETQAALADYEQQIQSAHNERAAARDQAAKSSAVRAPESSKRGLPKGSGTSIHANKRPGFFVRLFGKK